nr:hypothetical protein [Escherichia coli]
MQMLKRRSDAIYLTEMGAFIARRITDWPTSKNGYINSRQYKHNGSVELKLNN